MSLPIYLFGVGAVFGLLLTCESYRRCEPAHTYVGMLTTMGCLFGLLGDLGL